MLAKPIRFKGFPTTSNHFAQLLRDTWGVSPIKVGDEWVVDPDDSAFNAIKPDSLTLHAEIELDSTSATTVASTMASTVPPDLDAYFNPPAEPIDLPGFYGRHSDLYQLIGYLMYLRPNELSAFVVNRVLPFMRGEFGATHLSILTLDPTRTQRMISVRKIAMLVDRYGFETAQRLVNDTNVLDNILPNITHAAAIPESFCRLNPYAKSLSLFRRGAIWHFYKKEPWRWHIIERSAQSREFDSLFEMQLSDGAYLSKESSQAYESISTRELLELAVLAADRLFSFIDNIKLFLDEDGSVDFHSSIRMLSSISVLIQDLRRLGHSNGAYERLVFSTQIIDKLSNLRCNLRSKGNRDESKEFGLLISSGMQKQLSSILHAHDLPTEIADSEAVDTLVHSISRLHNQVRSDCGQPDMPEESVINWLYSLRNLKQHGAMLRGDQFDALFMTSRGEIPSELPIVAYMLVLALMVNPARFLDRVES
jgi:hypothetical protein